MVSNFAEAMMQGYAYGTQQRENREQRSKLAELAGLAPQVIAGDLDATNRSFALDPRTTMAYQGEGDRRRERLGSLARSLKDAGKNPAMQAMLYRQAVPYLREQFGPQVPDEFDQATVMPVVEQVLATMPQVASGDQFTLTPGSRRFGPDGRLIAEVPFAPANAQLYTDADGGVHWLTPPDRNQRPATMFDGGNDSPTTRFSGPDGMPMEIGNDIDERTRQDLINNPGAWNVVPDGGSAELPPIDRTPAQLYGGGGGSIPGGGGSVVVPGVRGPRKTDNRDQFVQLTPDEVQRAGLPAGTVAQRNVATGGIDVVSKPDARDGAGGAGTPTLSAGEAASVRKQFKETKDAFNMFKAFDQALADIPNDPRLLFDGAAKGRLGTAYNNARASLRILYNTGVLQPGELPMLENALRDPTSFSAVTDPRTRAQIDAQLDELYRVIERNIDTQVQSYPQIFNGDVYRQRKAEAQRGASRYKVGQVITEGDRRYRVTGGDLNGNPDVEEVR